MSGGRRLRAVNGAIPGEMAEKVAETLENLELRPEDAGLRALALRYAVTIDEARQLAEEAAALPYDEDTVAMVARLKTRVDAHTVMVDVGPKLLAALDALGATPKARSATGKPQPSGSSALAALRSEGA